MLWRTAKRVARCGWRGSVQYMHSWTAGAVNPIDCGRAPLSGAYTPIEQSADVGLHKPRTRFFPREIKNRPQRRWFLRWVFGIDNCPGRDAGLASLEGERTGWRVVDESTVSGRAIPHNDGMQRSGAHWLLVRLSRVECVVFVAGCCLTLGADDAQRSAASN